MIFRIILNWQLLAGPSPFSEAVTNNACKSTRQACAMVQQITGPLHKVIGNGPLISHYATGGPGQHLLPGLEEATSDDKSPVLVFILTVNND